MFSICLLNLVFVIVAGKAFPMEYVYDNLAGGWLKYHDAATWEDAAIQCDSEDGILVSPVNSELRDAVRDFLVQLDKPHLTIMSGVQAEFSKGDYYSVEGVSLTKMPVVIQSNTSGDGDRESCVKWMTGIAEMGIISCSEKLPFVCYKKRESMEVVGCGTLDPEYKYDSRSMSCYKFHRAAQTWRAAYKTCKKENGYLAIINNPLENVVLMELFAKNPANNITGAKYDGDYAHVGFRDWQDGESWKTVKSSQTLLEAGYAEWADGEPNNVNGNEHCGSMYRHGKYNDVSCDYKCVFICEKDPKSLPKEITTFNS